MVLIPKTYFKTNLKIQKELDLKWANMIKERDGYNCVVCNSCYRPNAHHLIPREIKEYRHELWNGITLCVNHHKFSRILSAHNSPFAFFLWLKKYRNDIFIKIEEETRKNAKREQFEI